MACSSIAPSDRICCTALIAMRLTNPARPTWIAPTASLEISNKGIQSATITAKARLGVVVINPSHVGTSDVIESTTFISSPWT